jgi:hypothetical protein
MSAVVTENQQDLPLVVTYMHQDSADCAVVHTMEHPSDDAPYHYLGYKYLTARRQRPTPWWSSTVTRCTSSTAA